MAGRLISQTQARTLMRSAASAAARPVSINMNTSRPRALSNTPAGSYNRPSVTTSRPR
jgi:hypothetical protein